MQRWPAVPAAENVMPRAASSRSADGATTAALLPPSSSSTLPKRAATRGATAAPMRSEPVALSSATSGLSTSAWPASASATTSTLRFAGAPQSAAARSSSALHAGAVSAGHRRRLPDHGVAAHERDRGVPRPDRRREVEGRDDADDAERVPGLHEPVPGPLGRHRPPVELAREPDREVADVDHLLDLAERLGRDLAGLDRDELGERLLVLGEQDAEALDDRAAHRRGHGAPGRERLLGGGDRRRDLGAAGGRGRRTAPRR